MKGNYEEFSDLRRRKNKANSKPIVGFGAVSRAESAV
jgi:hypothetical protein